MPLDPPLIVVAVIFQSPLRWWVTCKVILTSLMYVCLARCSFVRQSTFLAMGMKIGNRPTHVPNWVPHRRSIFQKRADESPLLKRPHAVEQQWSTGGYWPLSPWSFKTNVLRYGSAGKWGKTVLASSDIDPKDKKVLITVALIWSVQTHIYTHTHTPTHTHCV